MTLSVPLVDTPPPSAPNEGAPVVETSVVPKLGARSLGALKTSLCRLTRPDPPAPGPGGVRSRQTAGEAARCNRGVPGADRGVPSPPMLPVSRNTSATISFTSTFRYVEGPACSHDRVVSAVPFLVNDCVIRLPRLPVYVLPLLFDDPRAPSVAQLVSDALLQFLPAACQTSFGER